MSNPLYAVKMRASRGGEHISGAEKIVPRDSIAQTVASLTNRALAHPKGSPDFVNVKVIDPGEILRLNALNVTTYVTHSPDEGRRKAAELLRAAGIVRIDEIMARFSETSKLRGAMILDAETLERLDPETDRGVRATLMDDAASTLKGTAARKSHYAEAIVLATKVQHAPGIIGEICVSDDPDYVTGYVATREIGYCRITTLKSLGSPEGGRIFLYRGPRENVAETIRFLEHQAVLVENVPLLPRQASECRFAGYEAALHERAERHLMRKIPDPEESKGKIILSSNDYLALASEPSVRKAGAEGFMTFGAGSTGARLTTGSASPHRELERRLAAFKGTEGALLFATGYMANVGTISALVGKNDVILSDELNHASIIDGCRLSGARIIVYGHNDLDDLSEKLALCRDYPRRLVVSDGVFSMDGDILDLPRFLEICRAENALSMIDEAHATGVIGATGRGLVEHFGCAHPDIVVGTLSKALGSEGGFVCASKLLIDTLINNARAFIFSTAPAPGNACAALAALSVLEASPERVERLRQNREFFINELRTGGLNVSSQSAIVPIITEDEERTLDAAKRIADRGFLVSAIRYPTVARGKARLRVALSSAHTKDELRAAARAILTELRA